MKRTPYLLAGVVLFLVWACPARSQSAEVAPFPEAELRSDPQFDEATYQKLQTLAVDISWDKEEFTAVLHDLTLDTQKADPTHTGIQFLFDPAENPDDIIVPRKISILLMGVPAFTVLEALSNQTPFRIRVHKGCVLLQTLK